MRFEINQVLAGCCSRERARLQQRLASSLCLAHHHPQINREMGERTRTFILIFFFWALLTIITPTLINWSAAAKEAAKHHLAGDSSNNATTADENEFKVRRMMMSGYLKMNAHHDNSRRKAQSVEVGAPVPAPSPAPMLGADEYGDNN